MSNYNWNYPNTVWFGNKRIKDLAKACKILNIKKPLFVTDKDLIKTKMVQFNLRLFLQIWHMDYSVYFLN